MATETLEDNKPQQEAPVKDKDNEEGAPAKAQAEENEQGEDDQGKQEEEAAEPAAEKQEGTGISHEVGISGKNVDEKAQESDKVEEKSDEKKETTKQEEQEQELEKDEDTEHEGEGDKEEDEEEEEEEEEEKEEEKVKGKVHRKGIIKVGQSESKKSRKEKASKEGSEKKSQNDPATPASERPTRERKTVERYNVSSPAKFPRSSSSKSLSIEKGHGSQLKDIPNVAFKLSKRKPDDNLRMLHGILFGKKAKAHNLKRNIGQFSGYVWAENEEKQKAKIKERIDKCVKEKLVDFCDVLNIPINKTGLKKEELSAKLLEFLESPHATTDVLLADKEKKGKKRTRKATPSKSSGEASKETPAKMQNQTSQVGKKRKRSSDIEEDDTAELSDAKDDSQEDGEDVSVPKTESDHEESKSEEEEKEDKQKTHKHTSKKIVKEGSVTKTGERSTPVKKTTTVKAATSIEKTPKKSTSRKSVTDSSSASVSKLKQSASKKLKTVKDNQDSKGKAANKKQTDRSSEDLVKNRGKGKGRKKAKAEPSREELHAVAVDILKEVDFNTATLSDILRQLGTHFGVDLMHRKAEVKDIITDVISNMSDEDEEEAENDDADKDDA